MSHEPTKPWPTLTSREEFTFLTSLVFRHATADHVSVTLEDTHGGTTRFANNQVIQNLDVRKIDFRITAAFGQRHGTASTTDLTAGAVQEALKRAEALARMAPDDPEYLPPPGPQSYRNWPTYDPDTASAGPSQRLMLAHTCIARCDAASFRAAGIVASSFTQVGVAASTGLFAFEPRTEAQFSVTVHEQEASGWAAARHRSINRLDVTERTEAAIATAQQAGDPQELPAGPYRVVLAPPAVAGLLSWCTRMLDAKSYERGTSPFRGKLGKPIFDSRLTLRNEPGHPDVLGMNFTKEGLPIDEDTWIEKGILQQLAYDRFTARRHRLEVIPTLSAPVLRGSEAVEKTETLIRGITRGMYVSNFWYIRPVNLVDLTLTGMTRDGTFLIEDGRIVTAVRNLRFHESPLRAFNRIESLTEPREAVTAETGKYLVPAMRIHDFYFSSVSPF